MEYGVFLIGERRPRLWAVGVTALILLVFSAGFLGGLEIAFGMFITLSGLAVAIYVGVQQGGLLTAQAAVSATVYWRAVFPPLIGFLRWDDAARYTTISLSQLYLGGNHLYMGPMRELTHGIEVGFVYSLLAALLLGSTAYGIGALYRHLRRDDPSTHPYVTD